MKMEKILLFEVGRESFSILLAQACLSQIRDVVVEAPQLWNHHARRSGPRPSLLFGQHVIFMLFDLITGFGCFPCCHLALDS